jgi:hypothetical protein
MIDIPPQGSFLEASERLRIAFAELKIALLETLEDAACWIIRKVTP